MNDHFVYVGTFTPEFTTIEGLPMGHPAEGISVFRMDATNGALTHIQTVPNLTSPSFVALHPTLPRLYAVERQRDANTPNEGVVTSFELPDESGHLELLDRQGTAGKWPSYVSVHGSGGHLYVTNIETGNVVALPLDDGGHVGEADTTIQHQGIGTHPRGDGPRTHCVVPNIAGSQVAVADIGLNTVSAYPTDATTGGLSQRAAGTLNLPAGSGPRHLAFHPRLPNLYVVNELNSTLTVIAYDDQGHMAAIQTMSTVPDSFSKRTAPSDVLAHPNGRFVYATNRGHDSIAVFKIDQSSGSVELRGHEPSGGRLPRVIATDRGGEFLLVANQWSGTIVSFRLDQQSGWPHPTGFAVHTPTPVSLALRDVSSQFSRRT